MAVLGSLHHRPRREHQPQEMRALLLTLAIVVAFMGVEVIGGIVSGSLALLADAGHMAGDGGALLVSLFALWIARRRPSARQSYGYYRAEILAALANAAVLLVIAALVLVRAYHRFQTVPEIDSLPMLIVALLGLGANVAGAVILLRSAKESQNVRGAFFNVIGDGLGSIGAVTAGLLMFALGWYIADPLASVFTAIMITVEAGILAWQTIHILIEGTPPGLHLDELREVLETVPGVLDIHDLHAWAITSGYHLMSAHICVSEGLSHDQEDQIVVHIRDVGLQRFALSHVTVQLEHGDSRCPDVHSG